MATVHHWPLLRLQINTGLAARIFRPLRSGESGGRGGGSPRTLEQRFLLKTHDQRETVQPRVTQRVPRPPNRPLRRDPDPSYSIRLRALMSSPLWWSLHEWTVTQLLISDAAGRERAGGKQPTAGKKKRENTTEKGNAFPSCAVGGAVAPGCGPRTSTLTKITMAAPAAPRPCAPEGWLSFFFFSFNSF